MSTGMSLLQDMLGLLTTRCDHSFCFCIGVRIIRTDRVVLLSMRRRQQRSLTTLFFASGLMADTCLHCELKPPPPHRTFRTTLIQAYPAHAKGIRERGSWRYEDNRCNYRAVSCHSASATTVAADAAAYSATGTSASTSGSSSTSTSSSSGSRSRREYSQHQIVCVSRFTFPMLV